MAESVEIGKDKWVLQHYIPVEKCRECAFGDQYFWNNRDSSSSSKETLTKLEEHLFNKHNITKHDSVHNIEYDENNEVPVRGFIRKHFSKLKDGVARCNLCSKEIDYKSNYNYYKLLSHLKKNHEEKLTKTEKNFVTRIRWHWDHFTEKDERAICKWCNKEFKTGSEFRWMIAHLKFYMKPGPSSSSHTNNTNSNTDMGTHAKETNKCQKTAHFQPMVEREADNESVLQYYIPTLICKKCDYSHSLNNEASLSLSKETLTTLEKHLLDKHKIKYDSVQDDINKEEISVRRYIRKHFSKLKEDMAKCNICFEVINYQLKVYILRKQMEFDAEWKIPETYKYRLLHEHLKYNHEDKLTEIQKKERKILWYWDYYTMEKKHYWICNITTCKMRIHENNVKIHFEAVHKKIGPSSSSNTDNTDYDTDMGQPTKEADRQENTNSLQNRTAIMAEPKTEDNKITSPSSSRNTDDTNIATDMGTSTKEAKRQGDSKTLSKNVYKVTSAISAGTSEETSDSTFYRTLPTTFLTDHLKPHKETSPCSSRDTDDTNIATDMGTCTKEAKRQGDSKALSNNMYKMALATSAGTSEETSSHNEPSSSSSYGYDMDFSAQHQSQEPFDASIPLSKRIKKALDIVNNNVPSTSESTVSFNQSDFESVVSEEEQRLLQTLFSLQEELYQT